LFFFKFKTDFRIMNISGKLIQLLPLQSGTGQNGEWKKQEIIIETSDKYPRKVCISVWGDRIDMGKLVVGNQLNIDFSVESREYNGRWYTDVKANIIDLIGGSAPVGVPPAPMPPVELSEEGDVKEDLPF
jgi:hypothetical protein